MGKRMLRGWQARRGVGGGEGGQEGEGMGRGGWQRGGGRQGGGIWKGATVRGRWGGKQ